MSAWEDFVELTSVEPAAWLLYPDDRIGGVTLEFFDLEFYVGPLEQGAGVWRLTGTLPAVVAQAQWRYQEILKRREEERSG